MITKQDIEMLNNLTKAEQDLADMHTELLLKTKEEEARREAWGKTYHTYQGKLREIQTRISVAASVRTKIFNEIPIETRRAAEVAAAALRGHAGACDRARRDVAACEAALGRAQGEAQRTGFPIEKAVLEEMHGRIAQMKGVEKNVEASRKVLDAEVKKTAAALAEAERRIKAMAK